jgi:hypothetical protein
MPSQGSYENLLGRLLVVIALLKTWVDYLPTNILITVATLQIFVDEVRDKNDLVDKLLILLTNKRKERKPKVFRGKEADINCLQNRVAAIVAYLKSEFGKTSGAYLKVYALYKKFAPTYPKKKDPTLPKGSGRSPSERSFASVTGYASEIVAILVSLGAAYNPTNNTAIQLANFTTFVTQLLKLNEDIGVALKNHGDAVKDRENIYNAPDGLKARVILIKDYLESFEGGKKGQKYSEVNQALKGF